MSYDFPVSSLSRHTLCCCTAFIADYLLELNEQMQNFTLNRGQNKQDEALECYERAANLFKMAKKWSQAGNTFVTLAQHHTKLGNKHESATNYVNASNCYKKSDPNGTTR